MNFKQEISQKKLDQLISKHKNLVVGFLGTEEKGKEINELFRKIAENHREDNDFFFTTVLNYQITSENLQKWDITHQNEIHFYINGFRKKMNAFSNLE